MKAIVCRAYGAPREVTSVQSIGAPRIVGDNEVLIEVHHATVSHATGLLIEGRYQKSPPFPFVPGTEGVGRVLRTGSTVRHVQPGDTVVFICDWGAYSEQLVVHATTVYPVPKTLDPLKALALPISYGTAYTALHWRAQVREGDSILVLGAGSGVGLAAVELAAQIPNVTVIACASNEGKRLAALRHGAQHAVDPQHLIEQVKQLTHGLGASIVFDPVGGDLLLTSLRCTAPNGKVLIIGFASGTIPQVPMNIALVKNLTIHGFFYGQYIGWTPANERERYADDMQSMMAELLDMALREAIHPGITQVLRMTQLCDALDALHGRAVVGKLALAIHGDAR
ncbi:NADPH:quinone oxidoreductase family protein [Diaphorobacter sp. HDW4A]|uniref:NADPH:quinone oxidoreductase family protein n=1 Tax=Diaphorobacter sp. HDW4A TaxID=2714924 RepID=UPI00140BD269|nr:NADPH:quinone oxidoreductase family protein [Diaphorobacter sp. HDW4A]QIL82860.1 NADPH:quinone oxidoreductase family protein [Diaphorobacter sp. HDW4A]